MTRLSLPLRLSSPKEEGTLRVSKWLKYQLLLSEAEMQDLFSALSPFYIFATSDPVTEKNAEITHDQFLSQYQAYVSALQRGELSDEAPFRKYFSSIFTTSKDILYAMKVGEDKFLIKALRPVIQLQVHHFFVSEVDGSFHPMVLSKDSVTWGIQFSYPQIFQDPKTHEFSKVVNSPEFPNTVLFTKLLQWVRKNTTPTPFMHNGKKTIVPMRLGKSCFSWINAHPNLKEKNLAVLQKGPI
jgi:hypothetical protein